MYTNLLVALDGSRFAERALGPALELAARLGARVTLVRVVTPELQTLAITPGVAVSNLELAAQTSEVEMQEAEGYLDTLRRRAAGREVAVSVEVTRGDPAEMILDTAHAIGADLIVMTTHGRTGFRRLIYGSVAEAVLRGSTIPLLVIPIKS
jgi:nucleotide-binding universal stress UspA family protein